jgi:hypothetical protein
VEAGLFSRVPAAARVAAILIQFLNSLNRNMKNKDFGLTLENNLRIPN